MKINRFNIRVYGIILKNNEVLCLNEEYQGEKLIKFPGGGLEFGEGTIQCLERELTEELNIKVINIRHFYTQEDFIKSKFREDEQLLTIYYLADYNDNSDIKLKDKRITKATWLPINSEKNPFNLSIDRLVYDKLIQYFK